MQTPSASTPDADVAVIGAGVVGMAAAWALAQRGRQVLLLDRAEAPGLGTSFANGAQLSYAYTDAMASPALWGQLPGMLLGRDAAFRARFTLQPHFLRWGMAFLRNATPADLHRNTLATLALALESRAAMAALLARHPIDFLHKTAGKLHALYTPDALPKARAMIAAKRPYGIRQELLSAEEAVAVEPALAGARGLVAAVHSPDEEVGDPWRFCVALHALLTTQYGLQTRFGFDAHRLLPEGGGWRLLAQTGETVLARHVMVCAGIDSHTLLRRMGLGSPLMAVKGYSFTAPPGPLPPKASITDTSRKLVFCPLGDRIRVAGLADLNHWDPHPDPDRFAQLVAMAQASLPEAIDFDRIEHRWAGLRPVTPQSTPVIRRLPNGLIVNIGHGMLGWTLAMGSGERAARLVEMP